MGHLPCYSRLTSIAQLDLSLSRGTLHMIHVAVCESLVTCQSVSPTLSSAPKGVSNERYRVEGHRKSEDKTALASDMDMIR